MTTPLRVKSWGSGTLICFQPVKDVYKRQQVLSTADGQLNRLNQSGLK